MKLLDILAESMADGGAFKAFVDTAIAKHETQTNESTDKDPTDICPVCQKERVGSCRCAGIVKHTVESLKNGHGLVCENGHRWSYQTADGNVIILNDKN